MCIVLYPVCIILYTSIPPFGRIFEMHIWLDNLMTTMVRYMLSQDGLDYVCGLSRNLVYDFIFKGVDILNNIAKDGVINKDQHLNEVRALNMNSYNRDQQACKDIYKHLQIYI